MKRGVVALLAAKAVSDIGTALDFICLSVFVWLRTESTFAVAAVGIITYGGGALGGRLAHRYGDHWDRRRVMIVADLARAAGLLPLVVLPDSVQMWWLYPAVLLVGGGQSVFGSTLSAATPVIAGDRTQLVNSLQSGLAGVARIVGMGLAAVIVGAVGYRGVFALDAGTYLVSALAVALIRLRLRDDAGAGRGRSGAAGLGTWPALVAAGLLAPMLVRGMDAFGSSSQHVGLPVLGAQLDPADPARVTGLIWMVWAIGSVTGSFGLRPLVRAAIDRAPAAVFYGGTILMSVGFIGIFSFTSWPLMLTAAALAGVGDALSQVAFREAFQRLPDERRGSAFGLAQIVINGGFLSGLLVTGLVVTPDFVPMWVLLLHGVPMLASLYAIVALRRSGPAAEDEKPEAVERSTHRS